MLFSAFPIVYQQNRGWSQGVGGLAFLGIMVGMLLAVGYAIWDNKRYLRAAERAPGGFAPPEARLPPCLLGCVFLPVGMFWFAWTNYPSISWVPSVIAGAPFGFGMGELPGTRGNIPVFIPWSVCWNLQGHLPLTSTASCSITARTIFG